MNFNKIALFATLACVAFIVQCTFFAPNKEGVPLLREVKTTEDLKKFFPKTVGDVNLLSNNAIEELQQALNKLIAIPLEQKTFKNTIYAFDQAYLNFRQALQIINLVTMVYPDDIVRKAAQEQLVILNKHLIEQFSQNKNLYNSINDYYQHNAAHEKLSKEELYFITTTLDDYKQAGITLPEEIQKKVASIKKELTELTTEFNNNIYADASFIMVSREELEGLDDNFIKNLTKDENGLYKLGVDNPTYLQVMMDCSVSETRKKLFDAYNNRAYPQNVTVLQRIIEKRDQLAKLLGFKSFAHLSISNEMAETPEHVEQFLNDLIGKTQVKDTLENNEYLKNLPSNVTLSPDGKIYPWDKTYLIELYKKNNFNIDENLIAQYFPMDHTIEQLLTIYRQFLNIDFQEESVEGLWHPDIKVISVYQNKQHIGYVVLDLYPRPNKYSHACQTTIIKALKGYPHPALAVVIANFPKATATEPSLLKRSDVKTFFHEFGHTLHALLGATELCSFSGTNVKTDFVEMPSQMLEEWLFEPEILKQISYHYQTKEHLPDELITKLIESKNLNAGNDLLRQITYAFLSLNYFKEGENKDLHAIYKTLSKTIKPNDYFYENGHFYTSFPHLTCYDAKYYSYLWSKVFALDLFNHIKTYGLLNPEIGIKYKNTILAPGGSKHPNELLQDFLGRAPNSDAFMHDLGL